MFHLNKFSVTLTLLLLASFLTSCESSKEVLSDSAIENSRSSVNYADASVSLSYFDSPVFESSLRHILESRAERIEVQTFNSFSVNNLPEVFEKWIEGCSKRNGTVEMTEESEQEKPRGIVKMVGKFALNYATDQLKNKIRDRWYAPIKDYNIEIVYSQGNGKVSALIFHRIDSEQL